jgi:hypothetical protein
MSPQHDVRLEVDEDASNHGNGEEGNGFEVLMVIMEEKGSGEQVRLGCFGTAIYAVAFLFDGCPSSSSIRKLGTTIHDRFDDVIDGIELI